MSDNSQTIATPQSADLATFTVLVEGEELSAVYQVKNIEFLLRNWYFLMVRLPNKTSN